jgi:hypothetical protein
MGGKAGIWVAKLGRWVDKLVASLLDTAAVWVRIQTSLKNTKMGDKSGQHTLARQKIYKKNMKALTISPKFNHHKRCKDLEKVL